MIKWILEECKIQDVYEMFNSMTRDETQVKILSHKVINLCSKKQRKILAEFQPESCVTKKAPLVCSKVSKRVADPTMM